MKKLLALMLAFVVVFALGACAKEPTAEELYTLAAEKSAAMDKMDAEMSTIANITMKSGDAEQPMSMEVTGSIKAENLGKEGMKMAMPMKTSSMGVTIDMDCYFADGWYMMEMTGQKIKTRMDIEEVAQQMANTSMQPLEYITLQEMTKDDAGVYAIPFTMDMEKAIEQGIDSSVMDSLGVDPSLFSDIKWETCAGTLFTDKEGNIKKQQMAMKMTTTTDAGPVEFAMDFTILTDVVYNDIGADFTVEVPDHADYMEVSTDMADSVG